nr:MAG TPA: hypothetical protein [Caudoviricetes sp.]
MRHRWFQRCVWVGRKRAENTCRLRAAGGLKGEREGWNKIFGKQKLRQTGRERAV